MPFSEKKNIDDTSKLSGLRKKVAEDIKKAVNDSIDGTQTTNQQNPRDSGLYGTPRIEAEYKYSKCPGEKVIKKSNAYITFGTDKPTGCSSGYGGRGAAAASRIDLVVGRQSMFNAKDGSTVDNSFQADAARIYISQLTDIDANFGVDPGKSGFMEGRSGIGIKADGVRIIGRQGVKIVTGPSANGYDGERNSKGGRLSPAPRIELIAGNNSEPRKVPGSLLSGDKEVYDPLQGVAMGNNVIKAFQDLLFLLQDFIGVVRKDKANARIFNFAIASAAALPEPLAGPIAAAAQAYFQVQDAKTSIDLWHASLNATIFDINYLQPFGYRYIESRNVKAT